MAEQYDLSPKNKAILEANTKRKLFLREEFLKKFTDPYRHGTGEGGTVFDPAIQRFMAMRFTTFEHFKPNPKTSFYGLAIIGIPLTVFAYFLKKSRDEKEYEYRTGQVSYRDRKFKFI